VSCSKQLNQANNRQGRKNMTIKRRDVSIMTVISMLLLAVAIGVSAQGPQRRGGPPPGGGFPGGPGRDGLGPITRDLNLSDEQKTQIQKITKNFQESSRALVDQLRTLHEGETDPLTAGFDEAAVRAAAEAKAKVEIELSVAHAKMLSQVGAVLTAEQKAQVAAKHEEFSQRQRPPRDN
jgi:Spy/CpxP family protein refolding chaperone